MKRNGTSALAWFYCTSFHGNAVTEPKNEHAEVLESLIDTCVSEGQELPDSVEVL